MNLALERKRVPWGGAQIRDVTSGFRMFSRKAVELLLLSEMKSRAFDFHLESLALLFRSGMRIDEVPISYVYSNSSLSPAVVREALATCMRLWTATMAPAEGKPRAYSRRSRRASSAASQE